MLKQLPVVAEQTEYTTLKTELLPRMHQLCLKTVSASLSRSLQLEAPDHVALLQETCGVRMRCKNSCQQ